MSNPTSTPTAASLVPDRAQFAVGTYEDGSGPVVTVAYDADSKYVPGSVWVYGGDDHSDRWVAFDCEHADAIADAIKQAAAALKAIHTQRDAK